MITILQGDVIEQLRTLPDESVHCCVTSPPYWGLRDYSTEGQIGLEKTPEEYVAKMVQVFREVRRVLRKDGTLWLNLGDSYCAQGGGGESRMLELHGHGTGIHSAAGKGQKSGTKDCEYPGLKPKDLCGIPWEVVKAMQRRYYTGRIKSERDRIWLAATIDAEGSICGFTHTRKDNGDIRRGIHLTVTNTNVRMLDECFKIWQTSKNDHNQHGRGHLGLLECHRWIAHDISEKQQLLAELYPYLICKKTQAMLAWNFCEISKQARGRSKSVEKQERCAWIVHALSKLNHLQTIDIPNWIKEPPAQYEDGWWLRSDIIWAKPNPMPESVTDRPTKAHEYLFLLTKSANYFYDAEAIKEQSETPMDSKSRCGFGSANGKCNTMEFSHSNETGKAWEKSPNRNKRSVWTVATAPYPEAHFATYPPDLIKPCILAGTSAKGCCAKCGSPWERIVEKSGGTWEHRKANGEPMRYGIENVDVLSKTRVGESEYKTIGWQPTCECNLRPLTLDERQAAWAHDDGELGNASSETTPCTVLDPFAGSGTTGAVALELGRKAVLIELNPKYVELIKHRCNVTPGLQLAV